MRTRHKGHKGKGQCGNDGMNAAQRHFEHGQENKYRKADKDGEHRSCRVGPLPVQAEYDVVTTEFISSDGLIRDAWKSRAKLNIDEAELLQ